MENSRNEKTQKNSLINDLLVSKLFYFFFYGAYGSLFPLLSIYFKQLGMNATHAGVLIGVRPFVEFLSAPFWGGCADRFRCGKIILILSLICWIVFTSAMYFIKPSTSFCLSVQNRSDFLLESPKTHETMEFFNGRPFVKTRLDEFAAPGLAPEILHEMHNISGYNTTAHSGLIKPPASTRVYKRSDVDGVFFILLIIIIVAEFLSAPSATLADACTLHYLGDAPEHYGKQRMYGPVGWALSMFLVGIALDYGFFSDSECDQTDFHERNYSICFLVFDALMIFALFVSTKFRFSHDSEPHEGPSHKGNSDEHTARYSNSAGLQLKLGKAVLANEPLLDLKKSNFNQQTDQSKCTASLRIFFTVHYFSFLVVIWWFGFGVGLLFCFLYWHLQDIGGSPSIFGIAGVITHCSEIAAYFFTPELINLIGHVKILYVGLLANVARFLYISWLKDPWLVLPLEVVQGISHAAVWAASTSYIARATPPRYKSSAQGILQGVYTGLGRACGALFGGIIITYLGSAVVFRGYGISCGVVLVVFFSINRYLDIEGGQSQNGVEDGPVALEGRDSAESAVPLNEFGMASFYGSMDWTQYVHQKGDTKRP